MWQEVKHFAISLAPIYTFVVFFWGVGVFFPFFFFNRDPA